MRRSERRAGGTERAVAVLRRVLALVGAVLRGLTILAISAAAACSVVWVAWLVDDPPKEPAEWGARAVVLAVALVPSAMLFLFVAGVNGLRDLPSRYRDLPDDVRSRARELRPHREDRGAFGVLGSLFELARLVVGSREVLSPFAMVTAALRPSMVFAAILAALAAAIEIPAALVALVALLG